MKKSMKLARFLLIGWLLAGLFLLIFSPLQKAQASAAGAQVTQSDDSSGQLVAGNYCVSCHMPDDPVLVEAANWRGGIEGTIHSTCPAVKNIQEELYYTERLMLAIEHSRYRLPDNPQTLQIDSKMADLYPAYNQLFDKPISSLDAFVSEAQLFRFRLNKVYTQLNELHEARQIQRILIFSGLASIFVLFSLLWGYWNSRSFLVKVGAKGGFPWKAVVLILIIFGFFVLPIFQNFAPDDVYTEEEQALQTVLDDAKRSGDAVERSQARAWMLARVATEWKGDDRLLLKRLVSALEAEQEAREQSTALWGESQAAREEAGIQTINLEDASVVTNQLNASKNRTWGLRMISEEWKEIDPTQSLELLSQAQRYSLSESGVYRDLDVAGLAQAWQAVDPQIALKAARAIDDPAIKSWALRMLNYIDGAVEAAREISSPIRRADALAKLARMSDEPDLIDEAEEALTGLSETELDYSLSLLAGVFGDEDLIKRIDGASAKAYAFFKAGDYPAAWTQAAKIVDPYERARAQSMIAVSWGNFEVAQDIEISFIRDRALRLISIETIDPELAQTIETPSEKVIALAYFDKFEEAWATAQSGSGVGGYPLVVLGTQWAASDPQSALTIVDALESEADKAAVMRSVAAVSNDQAIFDRALALALAARVRGDALSPVEASLALALSVSNPANVEKAFAQAYETDERISIK